MYVLRDSSATLSVIGEESDLNAWVALSCRAAYAVTLYPIPVQSSLDVSNG